MEQKMNEDELPAVSYGEQDQNGVDLERIRKNLRLTPTERLERHRRFARFANELRRAARLAGLRHDG